MEFSKLHIDKKLLEGIHLMGFSETTPIQEKCIPEIKAGKDVVGQSLTGSGKTAAFGLPILEKIVPGAGIQALVLTPTRELCAQVRDHLELMGKFLPVNIVSIFGGVGFYQQLEDIKIAEIVVATPGRLLDHINRGNIKFNTVKFVVLDEADKMFEMGFEEDVDKIIRHTPKERQTVMFSATMPRAAQNIIQKYLKSPVFIKEQLQVDRTLLKQVFYDIRREAKFSLLVHLLKQKTPGPAIVFCGTKREVDRIAHNLKKLGLFVMPVHGDLAQTKRQHAVTSFKNAKIDVLVATDVAARGLDIKDVTHVYNYDVPRTAEEYTHRIGRTARAGKKGDAVTLLCARDYENFEKILRHSRFEINQEHVPEFEIIETKKHDFGTDRFGSRENRGEYPSQRRDYGRTSRFGGQGRERREFGGRGDYSGQSYPRHIDRRRSSYQNVGQDSRKHENYPRNDFGKRDYNTNEQKSESQFSKNPSQGSSPRAFGNKRHEPSPKLDSSNWAAEDKPSLNETELKGGYERTPRTPEPLFPTSHYHPEYQKNKALIKTGEHKKGFDRFGRKHKTFEERRYKKQTGTDMPVTPESTPSEYKKPFEGSGNRYPSRDGSSKYPSRNEQGRYPSRDGQSRYPSRRMGGDNRRSFDRNGPRRNDRPRRNASDGPEESFGTPRQSHRPQKNKYQKSNYGKRKRY